MCVHVLVSVTHPLSSQLVDFGVANSFPSNSTADTFVYSDRETTEETWICIILYSYNTAAEVI